MHWRIFNSSRFAALAALGILCSAGFPVDAQTTSQTTTTSKSQSAYEGETRRKVRVTEHDSSLRDAEAALERGDHATAETSLKQITKDQPQNYRAWFDLGSLYAATKRDDLAVDAFRRSYNLQPGVIETNLNLGVLLASQGEAEAGKYLRNSEKLKPSTQQLDLIGRSWLRLGDSLSAKDRANAVDALEQAARLRPTDMSPRMMLGSLLENTGDTAAAEKQFTAASQIAPNSPDPLAALTNLYMRTKRYDAAEQKLRALSATQPDSATIHLQLGRVLAAQNKHEEALPEFEKTLTLEPKNTEVAREIANSQLELKRYDAATKTLSSLLASNPNDPQAHSALGKAYLQARRFEDAQNHFLAAIKVQPNNADFYGSLAIAASENKQYPLALRALDARGKLQPDTPGTYFLRATCYDHLGAFKEASEAYRHFLTSANGKFPDEEWKARHRLEVIDPESKKKQR